MPEPNVACSADTEWGRMTTLQFHRGVDSSNDGHNDAKSCPSVATTKDQELGAKNEDAVEREEARVDIAIIGGGLAGLAAAIGLTTRDAPCNCKVYERAPMLRSNSQGMLALRQNGLAALEQIHPDLPALVKNVGSEFHRVILRNMYPSGTGDDGKVETTSRSVKEGTQAKFGRTEILISWHQLQQVLASLLSPDIISIDHSIASFREDDESVLLRFDNGNTVRCKAVLACDGTFSVVRRQMLPLDRPIFFGQLNWNAIIPTCSLSPDLNVPNTVRAYRYFGEPKWSAYLNDCGSGQTFWQVRVSDPAKAWALSGNEGRGGLGLKGIKDSLLPIVEANDDLTAALKATPEEQIFERCIIARHPACTWRSSGGRVALVGDAAHSMHPNIGHGANSAFESASAVVSALVNCHEDWIAGLEAYEKKRKPRADMVQRFANLMGCGQSQGQQLLSPDRSRQVSDWVISGEANDSLLPDVFDLIESFDPCSQPGVSPLE